MDSNYNQQDNPYMGDSYGNPGGFYNYGGSQEPRKAPNIFQQFALAFVPPQYDRLTKVKTGSMICFVILLTLIATLISGISLAVGMSSLSDSSWTDALPDFKVSGGKLHMDGDFVYDENRTFIYMTDQITGFTYKDASELADNGYRNILLAGRDGLSLMQNGEYKQVDYDSLGTELEISKDWIVETFVPLMMVMMVLVYIIFYVGRTLWYFFGAMLYFLCGLLIAHVLNKKQPAGNLYRTAVYSKVLMFVVVMIFDAIPGVSFPLPLIVRILITLAFMGFAIAKLPDSN